VTAVASPLWWTPDTMEWEPVCECAECTARVKADLAPACHDHPWASTRNAVCYCCGEPTATEYKREGYRA